MQYLFLNNYRRTVLSFFAMFLCAMLICPSLSAQGGNAVQRPVVYQTPVKSIRMSMPEYQDRVEGVWVSQMAAAIMGFRFEHHTASVEWVDQLPRPMT